MTSKHTPGEYRRVGSTVYVLNEDGTNRIYAVVQSGFEIQPKRGKCKRTTQEECKATAQLFVAAPDLLEALRSAHKFIADQHRSEESIAMDGEFVSRKARPVWNLICSAIAKAEG